ncbi:MAG: alpha-2-macroglobulin [Bryobacterales bacterium]|nr:alpha-2-macroglobulin [Bryobacterales bacterium]
MISQQEDEAYFGLNSNQTFASGESPEISVWATNLTQLEFRVYKVRDPLTFFANLDEPHRFGGRAPRHPAPRTPIETFHRWKITMRNALRDVFRAQYTPEDRERIRAWMRGPAPEAKKPVMQFAQLPVLNERQLVTSWKQPVQAGERWNSINVPVPVKEKGLYLVEAVHKQLAAYTVVMVTDIVLTSKVADGRLYSVLADRKTGAMVSGADLDLIAGGRRLTGWKTDAGPVVEPLPKIEDSTSGEVLLLARRGDDVAATSIGSWALSRGESENYKGYIYTDRPVYRPGDKVHFKGVVRLEGPDGYSVPKQRTAKVFVQDDRGQRIYERDHVISGYGTFDGEFDLDKAATLGYYSVQIELGEYPQSGSFYVEEYKKPEYEVKVSTRDPYVLQGGSAQVEIDSRYYFGEPVANAAVEWMVYSSRYHHYFRDAGESDEFELNEDEGYEGYYGEEKAKGTTALNAEGKVTVRIPLPVNANRQDERIRVQAKVRDSANREIQGSASFVSTYGAFHIDLRKSKWLYKPGETVEFSVNTRRYEGEPVAVPVRVSVERREWRDGKASSTFLRSVELRTGADGKASGTIPVRESGSLMLVARATDANGRQIEDQNYLWVTGGEGGWNWSESRNIEIIPDKSKYKAGDTAQILVVAGAPGTPVFITVEAGKIYQQKVMTAIDGTVRYSLPITEDFAPNVYLNAAFLKDNRYYSGSRKIQVPAVQRKLNIAVTASKPQFKPGEKGFIEVEAKDWQGKAATNAEISLGVVDEAIYAVRPENVPEISRYFWGERYNQVYTFNSMDYYFAGEAGKRRIQLAERKRRKTLAQLKSERYVDPKVRKYFPDTALWLADVKTDARGRARVEITWPDALTTWRTTARAVTPETRVGSAIDRRVVRKNLILRLAVPRFFTVGDEVEISAIVMNYLTTPQRIQTTLAVEGLELLGPAEQPLEIGTRGEAIARYRVRATRPGDVKITGKALGTEESDAVELTIPVRPFGIETLTSTSGSISGSDEAKEFEIAFPEDAIGGARSLEIKVSPSVAGSIFGALEYLTSYPYGCTEQIMSSFLPNIIVTQALKKLDVPSNVDRGELNRKVHDGLERLYAHQHPDGGWGWWVSDESQDFMTAYVLYGLEEARQAGYEVESYRLDQARAWLRSRLLENQTIPADLRAFIGFALLDGGVKDSQVQDMLYAQRRAMTPHGLALAGLALHAVADSRTPELVNAVENAATTEGLAHWTGERDQLMGISYNTSAETTAFALKLLLQAKPESERIAPAVTWLIANRSNGYYWESTKTTAMVILGLTDYLARSGELKPNLDVEVFLDGKSALKTHFTGADALKLNMPTIRREADALRDSVRRVRVTAKGDGRVYWSATGRYFSRPEGHEREGRIGLNLLREYFLLQPVAKGDRTVYRLAPMAEKLKPGDVFVSRLTLTGSDWRYLMIEDPIPSGTEFIDRRESFELENSPPWWSWDPSAKEYRDDRAAIFEHEFDRGQRQFTHILRVVNPGSFKVSPASVQPMYQPGYRATTGSAQLEVEP